MVLLPCNIIPVITYIYTSSLSILNVSSAVCWLACWIWADVKGRMDWTLPTRYIGETPNELITYIHVHVHIIYRIWSIFQLIAKYKTTFKTCKIICHTKCNFGWAIFNFAQTQVLLFRTNSEQAIQHSLKICLPTTLNLVSVLQKSLVTNQILAWTIMLQSSHVTVWQAFLVLSAFNFWTVCSMLDLTIVDPKTDASPRQIPNALFTIFWLQFVDRVTWWLQDTNAIFACTCVQYFHTSSVNHSSGGDE